MKVRHTHSCPLSANLMVVDEALRAEGFGMTQNEQYHSAENKFERFRESLELISRFEFEFRRGGNFFEGFEFLVCSKFNHTHHAVVHVHVLWPVCTHTIPFRMLWRP